MSKYLLRNLWVILLITSCGPSSRNSASKDNKQQPTEPTTVRIIDSTNLVQYDFLSDKKPGSLMELPKSQDGGFVLSPGYYEAEFNSYCLQPGTPDPSPRDAYLQAPLRGYRKDIIESILRNSQDKPDLQQRNVQLLLWSVVSGSNFNKLASPVQSTAYQLLTPKQVFELKGGVMGVVKTVAAAIPTGNSDLNKLFDLGTNSYEAYERMAVLRQPSEISRPDYRRDQWIKQQDGYYVRHYAKGYQKVHIQVYVPDGIVDTASGKYLVFDPVSMLAIPANSNAQRLGIGAPVIIDIVRKVIIINKGSGGPPVKRQDPAPKPTNPKNPKAGS